NLPPDATRNQLQQRGIVSSPASAFRSQSGLCPQPANADRAHPRKNRAALVRAPSSGAPYPEKLPLGVGCRFAREIQTPRGSQSRIREKSPEILATFVSPRERS